MSACIRALTDRGIVSVRAVSANPRVTSSSSQRISQSRPWGAAQAGVGWFARVGQVLRIEHGVVERRVATRDGLRDDETEVSVVFRAQGEDGPFQTGKFHFFGFIFSTAKRMGGGGFEIAILRTLRSIHARVLLPD